MADNSSKPLEFYENEQVVGEGMQEFINDEIKHQPRSTQDMKNRLANSSETPETTGGDVDAEWDKAEDDGAESFGGHNPTPDQSDVEANAQAMGFQFQPDQEIDLLDKMQRRDRDRFELEEDSKDGDTI